MSLTPSTLQLLLPPQSIGRRYVHSFAHPLTLRHNDSAWNSALGWLSLPCCGIGWRNSIERITSLHNHHFAKSSLSSFMKRTRGKGTFGHKGNLALQYYAYAVLTLQLRWVAYFLSQYFQRGKKNLCQNMELRVWGQMRLFLYSHSPSPISSSNVRFR